eukprot:90992-Rhodomonas_salina.2
MYAYSVPSISRSTACESRSAVPITDTTFATVCSTKLRCASASSLRPSTSLAITSAPPTFPAISSAVSTSWRAPRVSSTILRSHARAKKSGMMRSRTYSGPTALHLDSELGCGELAKQRWHHVDGIVGRVLRLHQRKQAANGLERFGQQLAVLLLRGCPQRFEHGLEGFDAVGRCCLCKGRQGQ